MVYLLNMNTQNIVLEQKPSQKALDELVGISVWLGSDIEDAASFVLTYSSEYTEDMVLGAKYVASQKK